MKITANNLYFKTLQGTILNGVSFDLEIGHKNAICGPQGSGKLVLLLILGGYLKPSSGSIFFDDVNIYKNLKPHRQITGLGEVIKINPLIEELTVRENIKFCAKLYRLKDVKQYTQDLISQFNLKSFSDTPVKDVSPLVKSILSLICSLIGNKKIIFLAEPTVSLTTSEAEKFWEILNTNIKDEIVFFTTMNEAEARLQADHIIKLDHRNGIVE